MHNSIIQYIIFNKHKQGKSQALSLLCVLLTYALLPASVVWQRSTLQPFLYDW